MNLQLNLSDLTQEMLQKEASDKNATVSKIVSTLLENYFAMRKWRKSQESARQILLNLAKENIEIDLTDDELMSIFNNKKIETPKELLLRFANESPDLPMSEEDMMDYINAEIKAAKEDRISEFEKTFF